MQNSSAAIIFHMPNLHWENYSYPHYRLGKVMKKKINKIKAVLERSDSFHSTLAMT